MASEGGAGVRRAERRLRRGRVLAGAGAAACCGALVLVLVAGGSVRALGWTAGAAVCLAAATLLPWRRIGADGGGPQRRPKRPAPLGPAPLSVPPRPSVPPRQPGAPVPAGGGPGRPRPPHATLASRRPRTLGWAGLVVVLLAGLGVVLQLSPVGSPPQGSRPPQGTPQGTPPAGSPAPATPPRGTPDAPSAPATAAPPEQMPANPNAGAGVGAGTGTTGGQAPGPSDTVALLTALGGLLTAVGGCVTATAAVIQARAAARPAPPPAE
ncbi:hypothetical protein [Streptomyces sp. NPDC049555]|uniref:hypothetical protein n=1 Tax=Streptomyces sp. NPDC049555 TaxID=3154930 RepID=UPI0034481F02